MRLTVDEAYRKGLLHEVRVRLNGMTVECVAADEEAGYVDVGASPVGEFQPTRRFGTVQIFLGDRK